MLIITVTFPPSQNKKEVVDITSAFAKVLSTTSLPFLFLYYFDYFVSINQIDVYNGPMEITLYQTVLFSIILIFSLILSIQDIKKMSVSIWIEWISIFCALLCHLIFARKEMWIYIISSLIMGAFYFAVRKITKDKLGMADIWFGFFQGLFIIPRLIPLCLIIEDCIAMIFINKRWGKERFAFIPFMSIGLIICFIIGVLL